ncbi:hypothetical protein OG21DRAFT_1483747 [Imleria badia]|nr:hypothetical protein OG21DRAFT_1483747 [Imleria badia]
MQCDTPNLQSSLNAQNEAVFNASRTISNLELALKTTRENTKTQKADYDANLTLFRRDTSNLRSALAAQNEAVVKASQKISNLELALKTARENTETQKADYDTKVARFQRDITTLQSALDSEKRAVVRANQTISNLESALKTAHEDAETHRKADYNTKVTRLQRNTSNLQSTLDAEKRTVVKANQTISNLESALKSAREDAAAAETLLAKNRAETETLKADFDTKVARLHHGKVDLQAALGALERKVAEDEQRLSLGIGDFKQWMCESSVGADTLISVPDRAASSNDNHHILAHNALLKVRLENWSSAYDDAKKSIISRPSAMAFIVMALAQIRNGDELEKSMRRFDLAFANCNPKESKLLLLIKAIILFVAQKCDAAIWRIHDLRAISLTDHETLYYCSQVLGKMFLMQGDYEGAVQSLERGRGHASSYSGSDLETISLIFGWTFEGLEITVQRYNCESLYAAGRAEEATEALLKILDTFGEEIRASKATADWVMDLTRKCISMLESLGDVALSSGEHENAIVRYTSALSLNPSNPIVILMKRSKARASKEMWEDALMDANEVIERDPSSHRGYERKYAALHGAGYYGEASDCLLHLLSIIDNSPDEEIRRLRENYTTPRETIAAIDAAIHEIFSLCPLVLIDVTTGRLCNAQERIQMFKSEPLFKKLFSETAMTKIVDRAHIRQSVAKYFKWSMFSHTWEGKEPTFKDVNLVVSVWELDESPLNKKLRQFCMTVHEDGYRWAWSDTCCIDKDTSAILSQSLIAMYSWYEKAAETLVYLADVLSSAEFGDLALTKSRWMTRAWTLQELLASKVVRFYTRDWKLYLNDTHVNHKESPSIKHELAKAMGVAPETITSFQPVDLGVREKLRLASTRNATVEEDIAYSLIGIFSSDIVPRYGLGKTALGHLLENIVARTGDVTVIAWSGKSLPYNSALPASLAVYSQIPYGPSPMVDNELDTRVEKLRTQLALQDALSFYYRLSQLPRATFSNRCLQLPCIAFYVTKIGAQELDSSRGNLYRAAMSLLGNVEFRTADVMPLTRPRKLVFVHPWLRDLRDTIDGFLSDDGQETESDIGSEESEAGSDATHDPSVPTSALHAEPSARVDACTQALRLVARLGCPFNALLLEQQSNGQYKRVAAEHEIIVPGVPYKTNFKDIRAKVLEIV